MNRGIYRCDEQVENEEMSYCCGCHFYLLLTNVNIIHIKSEQQELMFFRVKVYYFSI